MHPTIALPAVKAQTRPWAHGGDGVSEELFRDFWWLIFPLFGMIVAIIGAARDSDRTEAILRDARARLEHDQ